jgi:hypothetical protein
MVLTALGHELAYPKTARNRFMSIGSIGSSTSFWQQDQNFWQNAQQNDNSIAATTSVINAMASAETSLGKGLAGIANSSALNRTNSRLMAAIQNVLNGNTGQTSSSTSTSSAATTTVPVAATGTGTAALSTSTPLSLLGVLAGGKISVTAGMHTTTYTSTGTDTVGDLLKAINTNSFGSAQVTAALNSHGNLVLTSKNTTDVILVGGLYASNIGFGVGNETFKPTKTTAPAPAPAPQTSNTTSSNAKTAKSYSTPATEMVGTAASLLSDSGAGGTLVDMLA